mmetsp:Transcript_17788/g.15563  ORF Transcript_17788/g.15563 Transcript_17788/m.15563 type:complete len:285 (-) Transcript_17788:140-994(-)
MFSLSHLENSSLFNSIAILAPTAALFLISATLDSDEFPPDSSFTVLSKKGVISAPIICCSSAIFKAFSMHSLTSLGSASYSLGTGFPIIIPYLNLRVLKFMLISSAAAFSSSTLHETSHCPSEKKNSGNFLVLKPKTGTPNVSSISMVLGISRIDLQPAETTATGVLPNSIRSAEISIVFATPLCTPPIPPVTKTLIPAKWAKIIVAATVVLPLSLLTRTFARSLLEHFLTVLPAFANLSINSSVNPILILPSMIAIVAGTAPLSLITFSTPSAVSLFCGYSMP